MTEPDIESVSLPDSSQSSDSNAKKEPALALKPEHSSSNSTQGTYKKVWIWLAIIVAFAATGLTIGLVLRHKKNNDDNRINYPVPVIPADIAVPTTDPPSNAVYDFTTVATFDADPQDNSIEAECLGMSANGKTLVYASRTRPRGFGQPSTIVIQSQTATAYNNEQRQQQWWNTTTLTVQDEVDEVTISGNGQVVAAVGDTRGQDTHRVMIYEQDDDDSGVWHVKGQVLTFSSPYRKYAAQPEIKLALNYDGSRLAVGTPYHQEFIAEINRTISVGAVWTYFFRKATVNFHDDATSSTTTKTKHPSTTGEWISMSKQDSPLATGHKDLYFWGSQVILSATGNRLAVTNRFYPRNNNKNNIPLTIQVYKLGSSGWTELLREPWVIQGKPDYGQQSLAMSGDGTTVALGVPALRDAKACEWPNARYPYAIRIWVQDKTTQRWRSQAEDVCSERGWGRQIALNWDGLRLAILSDDYQIGEMYRNPKWAQEFSEEAYFSLMMRVRLYAATPSLAGSNEDESFSLSWRLLAEANPPDIIDVIPTGLQLSADGNRLAVSGSFQGISHERTVVSVYDLFDAADPEFYLDDYRDNLFPSVGSNFFSLLARAGLIDILSERNELTLLVPIDAALNMTELMTLELEPLGHLLEYHILLGRYTAEDLALTGTVSSLFGDNITITKYPTTPDLYNDEEIEIPLYSLNDGEAEVLLSDKVAQNGVLHIVSNLLVPSNVTIP